MDIKDILVIVFVIIFVIVINKFFPDNLLSSWGNYIKVLFKHKK